MSEPRILIVGAADTGRAPMAAAILQRLLRQQGLSWTVESAGVVGHDGEPAEPEARAAMLALGLDISDHRARMLSDAMAAEHVLIAVESGVARVLHARYPGAPIATLGTLAGRPRDIPDPFRMQVGAWMHYAAEMEALLTAGLPRLRALVEARSATTSPPAGDEASSTPPPPPGGDRRAAVERAERLLTLLADMPAVVDWGAARRQLTDDLTHAEQPLAPGDLVGPYVALLRLALGPEPPPPARAAALRLAVTRLHGLITADHLTALAAELRGASG